MKIRNSFVSNSSSSSFIVAFDKDPESSEELRKIMFGDKKTHEGYSTNEIADYVFADIKQQRINRDRINLISPEMIVCAEVGGDPEKIVMRFLPDLYHTDSDAYWDIVKYLEEITENSFDDFIADNKGKILYRFEFGDEGGKFFGMLEHSDIFHKLNYEIISHH